VADVAGERDGFNLSKPLRRYRIREHLDDLRAEHAEVVFTDHAGHDLDRGLDRLAHLAALASRARGNGARPTLDPERDAFVLDAVRAFDERGAIRLATLTVDGEPIAGELYLVHRRRLVLLRAAHDPAWQAHAPDQVVRLHIIEQALATGAEGFDLGRADADDERHWATSERPLVTLTLTRPGVTGRLAAQRLRAARSLGRSVPAGAGASGRSG
jgi:CelD/BcsL family acetyltransferase involved in cellulose biosynthesis